MMDKKQQFFESYDIAAVIGCYRFGSTAMAKMIAAHYAKHRDLHGKSAMFVDELLNSTQFFMPGTNGGMGYIEPEWVMFGNDKVNLRNHGATAAHIMDSKFRWLKHQTKDKKISIKINPPDFTAHGAQLLHTHLFDDNRVFKLGLCRQDIGNALISFAIGMYFNFWIFNEEQYNLEVAKSLQPTQCYLHTVQHYASMVMDHLNYLLYSADRLEAMVWYEQLTDLSIPEMGMSNSRKSSIYKTPTAHADRASTYFTNSEELIATAADLQLRFDPLLSAVRTATDHLAYYG